LPELPEVEIAARNLRRWAVGHRIERAELDPKAKRIFRPHRPDRIADGLQRRRVRGVRRIGKALLIELEGPERVCEGAYSHLGMTGKWLLRDRGAPAPRFSRARLELDDEKDLHYCDMRLFGRLQLVPGGRFETLPEVAGLGPDPLEDGIDVKRLGERLARSTRPVKMVIMDQALLPGVGNIVASESLFRARIDPRRAARSLSRAEVRRLAEAVIASVKEAIAREDGPEIVYVEEPGSENPFRMYDRAGERCPRCKKEKITRLVQGGRSTFFCKRCQK
jgi:formamidopyrimidine-DNA glycosylase